MIGTDLNHFASWLHALLKILMRELALIHELIHQRRGDVAMRRMRKCGRRRCANPKNNSCCVELGYHPRFKRESQDYLIEDVKFLAESEIPGAEKFFNAVIAEFVAIQRPELRFSLAPLAGRELD
jgi:hypothetical protein